MSEAPEHWAFLATGWHLAHILTGCREGASKIFRETVAEVAHHPEASDSRLPILFYTILRRRSLRFPAVCELEGIPASLHKEKEPGRSALALLLLGALPADEIERVLGLDERQLASALVEARELLRASDSAAT